MLKILGQYNDNCTQLASKKIEEQLEYVSQCFTKPSKNQYAVTTRKGKESHMVTSCKTKMGWTCTCCFNQQSELPCRHIFSVLTYLGRPLFELSPIPDRWRENYQLFPNNNTLQNVANRGVVDNSDCGLEVLLCNRKGKPLTRNEKFRKAHTLSKELSSILSDCGMTQFNERYSQLQTILSAWNRS